MHSLFNRLYARTQYKIRIPGLRPLYSAILLASGIAALTPNASAQKVAEPALPAKSSVVPGEVLVGVRADQDDALEGNRLGAIGATPISRHSGLHVYRLRLKAGLTIEAAIASLQKRADVVYAEPNHLYHVTSSPNNTYYPNQYAPARIKADMAWDIWNPSATVVIAIVDTGVDNTHPSLTNKILRDGSGIVGFNALTGQRDDAKDDFGHGTHCAGIAAAQINNGVGIAGIAGWNGVASQSDTTYTKIMPVKVLDSTGNGSDANVADGITWAADHGAKVISLSLGGPDYSTTLDNAVQYAWSKGAIIVAAAGNSGTSAFSYPAADSHVISVAATDANDQLAYFSNYGSWVKVAAPGLNILSTLPTYTTSGGYGTNYNYLSGTSMATPHVAGEAALILAQNSALTNVDVTNLILNNVDPYTPYQSGQTIATGAGRINVYRALQAANGSVRAPNAPTGLFASPDNAVVNLSWNTTTGATSYNVKRSLVSGGPYQTLATNVTTTHYTDSGLTNGTTYYYVVSAVNSSGESPNSAEAPAIPGVQSFVYRIHSGSGTIGNFNPDAYYDGGTLFSTNQNIDTTGVANAAPMAVYQTQRYGNFSYNMPNLTPGATYTVRLHFAESYFTTLGQRFFNVAINNNTVLANFDIATAAGAVNKALVKDFAATANSSGIIKITFTAVSNWPLINGVEILTVTGSAPSAPTGLTAAAGSGQVNLTWNASSGASSYKVYRSTTSGTGYTLIGTPTTNSGLDTAVNNGTTYYYVVTAVNANGESPRSSEVSATPGAQSFVYRIHSGSGTIGSFNPDAYYDGGSLYPVTQNIDTTGVVNAAPMAVYQTQRYGNFSYNMPNLTPGTTYTVRLHFAESYFTTLGQRYFNVAINGNTVLANFDPATAAGAVNKALVEEFVATANSNGVIKITLSAVTNWPLINGVEILTGSGSNAPSAPTGLSATAGNARVNLTWNASNGATSYKVYRSTTSGTGYTLIGTPTANSGLDTAVNNGTTYYYVVTAVNANGESPRSSEVSATPSQTSAIYRIHSGSGTIGSFNPDAYYDGGSLYPVTQNIDTTGVVNAAPMAVYQTQRYGNFSYNMPNLTPGTTYTVRLHFAESYFTTLGQRFFNVAINGNTVLSNFDPATAAGAVNKAVVKDFTVTADSNGVIKITLSAVSNWPLINGVEILP